MLDQRSQRRAGITPLLQFTVHFRDQWLLALIVDAFRNSRTETTYATTPTGLPPTTLVICL
jgi:hypothetical protein